jgi:hypothetical protein
VKTGGEVIVGLVVVVEVFNVVGTVAVVRLLPVVVALDDALGEQWSLAYFRASTLA